MTKSTSGGCDQFETSPEAIDQELRTGFCERRQTDRLKTNYRIDIVLVCIIYMYLSVGVDVCLVSLGVHVWSVVADRLWTH